MSKSKRIVHLALLCFAISSAPTLAANYTAGVHYFELSAPQPVQTGSQIEVLELFWYGCPHCYKLEPIIGEWVKTKPKNAEHVRLPAVLRDSWEFHARVYYTFEAMDLLDKLHTNFFDELHKRKNRIRSQKQLTPYLKAHGISEELFFDIFNSFAVDSKVRHAMLMSKNYEAGGVPTIIVDGKYRATASSAGGHEQLLELVNFLIAKAANERT